MDSGSDRQPVQLTQHRCYVLGYTSARDCTSKRVLETLKFVDVTFRCTVQQTVAIVDTCPDQSGSNGHGRIVVGERGRGREGEREGGGEGLGGGGGGGGGGAQPILEYRWIDSYTQLSLRKQFKVATVYLIHTQSLSWCSTGLVLNVLPRNDEG